MKKNYFDKKKRILVNNAFSKRINLKGIIRDERLSLGIRTESRFLYTSNTQLFLHNKVCNRCITTSRSRGVKNICRLSRMQMRLFIHSGLLSGFYKKNASV